MNRSTTERLYYLLPAIYRQRDADQGQPLRALLAVLENTLQTLEDDIDGLYDNWFVETCQEWVLPYLGDLLGIRGLSDGQQFIAGERSWVANSIHYRRRKGIPTILEQAVRDATGWNARVVEFFELLNATQHVQHVRLARARGIDLRDQTALSLLQSPFDSAAHTVDVRAIARNRGAYNIPNIGLYVWRLQSYPILAASARAVVSPPDGRYTFNPLGVDIPLFHQPQPLVDIDGPLPAGQLNLPIALDPAAFATDLATYQARDAGPSSGPPGPNSDYYGPDRGLYVIKDDSPQSPAQVVSLDLSSWQRPPSGKIAIDVRMGRLAFAPAEGPQKAVTVSYNYAFSGDIGGGPYDRGASLAPLSAGRWQAMVSMAATDQGTSAATTLPQGSSANQYATLKDALIGWEAAQKDDGVQTGVIQIVDNGLYDDELDPIILANGQTLIIQAANGCRPAVRAGPTGIMTIQGESGQSSLTLNGVLVDGGISVQGSLSLTIAHCSIMPDGMTGTFESSDLHIAIAQSIVGPVRLPASSANLAVQDSIVDGSASGAAITGISTTTPASPTGSGATSTGTASTGTASTGTTSTGVPVAGTSASSTTGPATIGTRTSGTGTASPGGANATGAGSTGAGATTAGSSPAGSATAPASATPAPAEIFGPPTTLERCTIFGTVSVQEMMLASEVIFVDPVVVQRLQTGGVRYSYVPDGSQTPQRYRCQPDLAIQDAPDQAASAVLARLRPAFTSTRFGDPAYGQLAETSAEEVFSGGEGGSEMGVFESLRQPQRQANLKAAVDEYLRAGLNVEILYVT